MVLTFAGGRIHIRVTRQSQRLRRQKYTLPLILLGLLSRSITALSYLVLETVEAKKRSMCMLDDFSIEGTETMRQCAVVNRKQCFYFFVTGRDRMK